MPRLFKSPKLKVKKLREESWGTITVSDDTEIDHWIETMPAGRESCPYWYSIRLFKGTETTPGARNKEPEYWLGICNVFLMPILPIPIISDEIVIKLGPTADAFWKLKETTNHPGEKIMSDPSKFATKIINKATVKFTNCDINYNNDAIYSLY